MPTVGVDFTTGVERFTFGFYELSDGISFIAVMIGLFSISELLTQSGLIDKAEDKVILAAQAVRLPSMDDFRKTWKCILRGSGIGTIIGILPAEGGTVASIIAYGDAKRWSKESEKFGDGAIEGIAGPESANNAATGGAMVPTLALGIPGSSTTAVIIGALMVQGIRPGPHLFLEQPHFLYALFFAMLVANVLFLGLGLAGAKLFSRITLIPPTYLWPSVFIFSVVGAYSLQQSLTDVWVTLIAGLLGFRAAPSRVFAGADHHGCGARRDGREFAETVADHLRSQLAALLRAADRRRLPGPGDHRPVHADPAGVVPPDHGPAAGCRRERRMRKSWPGRRCLPSGSPFRGAGLPPKGVTHQENPFMPSRRRGKEALGLISTS